MKEGLDARQWVCSCPASRATWDEARRVRTADLLRGLREGLPRLRKAFPAEFAGVRGSLSSFLNAGPAAVHRIASHSSFSLWCRMAADLPARPSPFAQLFFDQFHGFSAGLACLRKRPLKFKAHLDDKGRFHFHGLRAFLDAGPGLGGVEASFQVTPDSVSVALGAGSRPVRVGSGILRQKEGDAALLGGSSGGMPFRGFRLRWHPSIVEGMEVNDSDPLIMLAADPSDPFQHKTASLTPGQTERFAAVLREAMALVLRVDALLASEIAESIRVIVPLERADAKKHVSSTYSLLPGAVFLCHDEDPFLQAETLVHEFCHNKLNALMALAPLFSDAAGEAVFFSPWRPDPRPLRGILLGAHAFLNVARFYALSAEGLSGPGETAQRLRQEAATRWLQVDAALDVVARHAKLTAAGRDLASGMRERLDEVRGRLPAGPGGVWGAAGAAVERHRKLYRGASGRHRSA